MVQNFVPPVGATAIPLLPYPVAQLPNNFRNYEGYIIPPSGPLEASVDLPLASGAIVQPGAAHNAAAAATTAPPSATPRDALGQSAIAPTAANVVHLNPTAAALISLATSATARTSATQTAATPTAADTSTAAPNPSHLAAAAGLIAPATTPVASITAGPIPAAPDVTADAMASTATNTVGQAQSPTQNTHVETALLPLHGLGQN